ncbi:glyceraldehyde-3-phosphate dehydrogenase [Halovulum dunhuangense]|uniref:Glyceraldehyde-3-phosphate dehydrogenase n=1 Tax=Halovulum dunhuangense TaxID=1505036 RepID=A0A849L671_9RHOB|nr:glyceraldehyde-3-phosphate dehydrogenase [Halovulum dunhuangense]NNU81925.1 glyceraldehyde-3-phosphate dehydrogenase [Halovulum dunhuangense]
MKPLTALLVVLAAAGLWYADRVLNDGAAIVFLGKQLIRITTWLAFWR